jgi:VIT1/CCC1 family predicted Fe2+/Mn2+ transporter
MRFKVVVGIMAGLLPILFMSPVVFKLKDVALTAVVVIGLALMIVDLVQSLRSGED